MKNEYDIAIIGGGLAGLCLSIQCADAGYNCILFEKEAYPFHKVCGEYISNESLPFLEKLGVPISLWNLPSINELKISSPNGKGYLFPLSLGGFGVSRYKLDDYLYHLAISKGVEIFTNTKVQDIHFLEDHFEIKTDKEKQESIDVMQDAFKLAKDLDIKISLETDLSPIAFKELLELIDLDFVQANYDIGNSASLGFDPKEELDAYGQRILNVHVKDRKLGGTTVPLGTGNANLDLVFKELNEINYSGGITMQAARGDDDVKIAKEQFGYVQSIIKNIR